MNAEAKDNLSIWKLSFPLSPSYLPKSTCLACVITTTTYCTHLASPPFFLRHVRWNAAASETPDSVSYRRLRSSSPPFSRFEMAAMAMFSGSKERKEEREREAGKGEAFFERWYLLFFPYGTTATRMKPMMHECQQNHHLVSAKKQKAIYLIE